MELFRGHRPGRNNDYTTSRRDGTRPKQKNRNQGARNAHANCMQCTLSIATPEPIAAPDSQPAALGQPAIHRE